MGATDEFVLPYPENTDPLADMAAAIQALANGVESVFTDTADWDPITLQNGWVNFGAPWQVCQCKRVGSRVYLRGVMRNGIIPATAFTLPVGFRPPANTMFCPPTSAAAGAGRLDIQSDGQAVIQGGGNGFVSIEFSFESA